MSSATAAQNSVPDLHPLGEPAPHSVTERSTDLHNYFETLSLSLGSMSWWPARTPFEVIVGAILTQNTAWSNVEKAIANLRRERLLTPRAIERIPEARLAKLIR